MMSIDVTWVGAMAQMEAQFGKAILSVPSEHTERVKVHVILGPCYVQRVRLPLAWNDRIDEKIYLQKKYIKLDRIGL